MQGVAGPLAYWTVHGQAESRHDVQEKKVLPPTWFIPWKAEREQGEDK